MRMGPYLSQIAWPFRPGNLPAVAMGAVLAVIVPGTLGLFPGLVIWAWWPIILGLAGYYAVFLHEVMENAMAGRDRIPAWPCNSLDELVTELVSVVAPIVTAFLPLAVAVFCAGGLQIDWWAPVPSLTVLIGGPFSPDFPKGSHAFLGLSWGLWLLGWMALPILLLAWPFGGLRAALRPLELLKSAFRAGREYPLVALFTALLFVGAWAVTLIPIPAQWAAVSSYRAYGVAFLSLIIAARVVGTFYRRHREALGWERQRTPVGLREDLNENIVKFDDLTPL
jgi:hypothetical protein